MKMKFKDFTFPSNPRELEVCTSTNIQTKSIYDSSSHTENVSVNPIVIKGAGEFFGEQAEGLCLYLQHLLKDKTAGELMLPSSVGLAAFFTEFTYTKNCQKGSTQYTFVFTEDCTGKREKRKFPYTLAGDKENAFDIANRRGISVSSLMQLNDFKTPFDIKQGDKVVLYAD